MKLLAALPLLGLAIGAPSPVFNVEGVCSLDEQGAACWDVRGAPLPALTAEIDRIGREMDAPISFNSGRKNRFLIVRQEPVHQFRLSSGGGNVVSFPLTLKGVGKYNALRIVTAPEAQTETITAKVGVEEGTTVDLPLREGARATIDGVKLELGRPSLITPDDRYASRRWGMFYSMNQKNWRFPFEASPSQALAFQLIGRDGKPIVYVDWNGRPIETAKGEAMLKESYNRAYFWNSSFQLVMAQANVYPVAPSPLVANLNVDPAFIAKLRVRRVVDHTEILGPFALEPRSP